VDAEYKIFIVDECFPANTLVSTERGDIPISEIHPSDIVHSMCGSNKVTYVFKNRVLTDRLCCVKLGDKQIVTTVDHLFFTNNGWIKAQNLIEGDYVYAKNAQQSMSVLSEGVSSSKQSQGSEVLFKQLCDTIPVQSNDRGGKTESSKRDKDMSYMWSNLQSIHKFFKKDLFSEMSGKTNIIVRKNDNEFRIWDDATETIIRKNVTEQSYEEPRYYTEDDEYEREERYTSQWMDGTQRWKREVHNSSDTFIRSFGEWLGIGISDKYEKFELERTANTLVLQSRPRLSRNETCSRSGWQRSSVEAEFIQRCEKDKLFTKTRVDSVEIYKRGYNDELFLSSFSDTELSSEYVTMYDLEVENDHSYCANGILVHNCHSISNTGWQALLKTIEEPPAKVVFIFCTTDPQKIPATILSRVQRYNFSKVSTKGIIERLTYIAEKEHISISDDAISFIAKLANGGMRLAIQYLEKCSSYSNDIDVEEVVTALNVTDYADFIGITNLLLDPSDRASLITRLDDIYASGVDFKQFLKQYLAFILDVNKVVILDDLNDAFKYINLPRTKEVEKWLSAQDNLDFYNRLLRHLVKLDADVKYSQNPYVDITAGLLLFEV
jgi:DNA polymerase III gamma/tau subunit